MHTCRCTCGVDSGALFSKQQTEDWWIRHEALVQQALVHLKKSTPNLKVTRDYYRQCSEDQSRSKHDRDLFKQMADELTLRVGDGDGPKWVTDELPLGLDPR